MDAFHAIFPVHGPLLKPFLVALFLVTSSCRDGSPSGPDLTDLEIVAVLGSHQAAEPLAPLPAAFQVRVQRRGNGAPAEDAKVRWEVVEGAGGKLDPSVSKTDSLGLSEARLTLGAAVGSYRVRASVRGMESPPAEFAAAAILVPTLQRPADGPVLPGDTVTIRGSNFSSKPMRNVVTFSRIRGRVVSATATELRVEIPGCLVPREHQLRVRIGHLETDPVAVQVEGEPSPLVLERGEDRILDASEGVGCFFLPPDPGSSYLVIPHSASPVPGAGYPFSLTGLTRDGYFPDRGPWAAHSPQARRGEDLLSPGGAGWDARTVALDARDRWEEELRALEARLVARGVGSPAAGAGGVLPAQGPSILPEIGGKRVFRVLNAKEGFDKVTARVKFISDHSLVYVDERAPPGGFSDLDLADLALEFEDPVYPTITQSFGGESDLDGNGRVIILFTPAVNRLTPPGYEGFIGGFFFGLDLLPGRDGSNGGEIFYAMVPDPSGEEGPSIGRFTALNAIPAVLAHEFEHMVHFNQRMLLKGAGASEALWLSEALAQMAEDRVGDAFERAREPSKALYYRSGNFTRARLFLQDPGGVSLLASLPPGTLQERGAVWLLLKQLSGRPGQDDLLSTLVSSTSSGIGNLTDAVGLPWDGLLADWAGALFMDGTSLPVRPELGFSGVNLRTALSDGEGRYPLLPVPFGGGSEMFSGTLWSSAPYYFIISPPADGVSLSVGGPLGGSPEAGSSFQVLVIRLQ